MLISSFGCILGIFLYKKIGSDTFVMKYMFLITDKNGGNDVVQKNCFLSFLILLLKNRFTSFNPLTKIHEQ